MADESKAQAPLKTIVFLGSARDASPPWGGDKRLGDRVLLFLQEQVAAFNEAGASGGPTLEIEVFDPLEIKSFQSVMRNPTYFQRGDDLSDELKALKAKVAAADAYIVVTPEYNHTIPPALVNAMDMFGGSLYSFKPSGCVCYSMTPLGGSRVAQALQPMLHELGCLPVSKQFVLPSAHKALTPEGKATGDGAEGNVNQLQKMLAQVVWWADACRKQRAARGVPK